MHFIVFTRLYLCFRQKCINNCCNLAK